MTTERIDPLAVIYAFGNTSEQTCCGFAVGGGMDENGNGEPPSCCGHPLDGSHLREAHRAVAELVEAGQRFFDAQCELDNRECAGPNAPPYDVRMRARNVARDDFEAALAAFGRQG